MDDINLRLIRALNSQKIYNKLGLAAIRIIRKRTRQSKDVRGTAFQKYTAAYIKRKARLGFANPSKVNLELSKVNGMLASIDYEVVEVLGDEDEFGYAEVSITDPFKAQLAYYHNVAGAGKGKVIREFWGIELDAELNQLQSIVDEKAREVLIEEIGDMLSKFDSSREI